MPFGYLLIGRLLIGCRLVVGLSILLAVSGCERLGIPSVQLGDPRTLAAAAAAAQERANRFSSGDYAGAWLLSSRRMQDAVSQDDYVNFQRTCANRASRLPVTAIGVRMDGSDRAIVREEVMGIKNSITMVYENGKWVMSPTDFWVQNAGRSARQLIDMERAEGRCGAPAPAPTSTSPTTAAVRPTPAPPPSSERFRTPGTRYAFPAFYSEWSPARERPSALRFEYRSHDLTNLSWTVWGPDGAEGTGNETFQGTSNPVRIVASDPRIPSPDTGCPTDVMYYTDVTISPIADNEEPEHYPGRQPYCG
jgi:hypothetical protein